MLIISVSFLGSSRRSTDPPSLIITRLLNQVHPWLSAATQSLRTDFVFPSPVTSTWKVTAKLTGLDSYKPMKDLFALMASCSQVLSQGKSCDVIALHTAAQKLPNLIHDLQADRVGHLNKIEVTYWKYVCYWFWCNRVNRERKVHVPLHWSFSLMNVAVDTSIVNWIYLFYDVVELWKTMSLCKIVR